MLAWYKSAAANGLTAWSTITDTSITPIGSAGTQYAMPRALPYLWGGTVISAHAARGKLSAPSLLKFAEVFIEPVDAAANPIHRPTWTDLRYSPPYVTPGDALSFYVDNVNNNEATFALAWIADGPVKPTVSVGSQGGYGGIIPNEATGSTSLTANAWSPVPITFSDALEAGTYKIVGLGAHFGGGIAARLVPTVGSVQVRPGVLATSTANKMMPREFRFGYSGDYLTFDSETPPQIECLGTSATASERFVLDLVKVASP